MICNNKYCKFCKAKKCTLNQVNFNMYGICENMSVNNPTHKKQIETFVALIES